MLLPKEAKINKIKNYFFTNMTGTDIMNELGISYNEYSVLIKEAKKELGLPSSYRRTPSKYGRYHEGAYMVYNKLSNEIMGYYPTEEIAMDNNFYNDCVVVEANDDKLLEIIEKDFDGDLTFDDLLIKYKLPYHKLLGLMRILKKRFGLPDKQNRSANKYHHIYKYPPTGKVTIKKLIDGKMKSYGYYDNYDDALKVRKYLESIDWNYDFWFENKDEIIGELL